METPNLTTIQTSGCTYPELSRNPDGTFAVSGNASSPRTFWSASKKPLGANLRSRWAVRQTTCGADEDDSCSLSKPYAFAPELGSNDTVACSLRTQAVIVIPIFEFLSSNIPKETTVGTGGSSFRTFVWTVSVVEMASSSAINATYGVNVFEWRVTNRAFTLAISPAGAVVETLAVGTISPPMFISVVATQGVSGGPSSNRLMADGRVRMIWQTNAYVKQKNAPASAPDTVLDVASMPAPEWVQKSGFVSECSAWTAAADGEAMAPGEASAVACATVGCVPIPQSQLPSSMFIGISKYASPVDPYWLQYTLKIVCYITPPFVADASMDIVLPETLINVPYALADADSGTLLTDATTLPFSQFGVQSVKLAKSESGAVSFDLTARLVILPESLVAGASALNDLFEDPESLPPVNNQLEYSQAFALTVQINSLDKRKLWRVRPSLILMAAHTGAPPTQMSKTITPEDPLDASFCGLDRPDLVTAWAITDASRVVSSSIDAGFASEPDALVDTALWTVGGGTDAFYNITDGITPELRDKLTSVITNNSFSDITAMQGDIMPAAYRNQGLGVAVVPDSTGGFGMPARNRFFLGKSTLSGYSISFCIVTVAQPYGQMRVRNTFPVYTDRASALRDTGSVNGVIAAPVAVMGTDMGATDALRYYVSSYPASTGGIVCTDTQGVLDPIATVSNTDPRCVDLMSGTPKSTERRHLLATAYQPLSRNLYSVAKPKAPMVSGVRPVTFVTNPPPPGPPKAPGRPPVPPPRPNPPRAPGAPPGAAPTASAATQQPPPPPPRANVTGPAAASPAREGLGTAAIAGIVAGCAAAAVIVSGLIFWRFRTSVPPPVRQPLMAGTATAAAPAHMDIQKLRKLKM